MSRHPNSQHAEAVLAALPRRERELLAHLLDCLPCRELALALLQPAGAARGPRPVFSYEQVWSRLLTRSGEEFAAARVQEANAERLRRELLAKPSRHRAALIEGNPRFRSLPLADALLEESYARTARDPGEAERLALLAVLIVSRLDPSETPETLGAQLRARAWSLVGEARRRRGELREADDAFGEAAHFLSLTVDLLERAAYCALLAALRRDQGRLEEAHALRDRARSLFEAVTEPAELGPAVEEQAALHLALNHLDTATLLAGRAFLLAEPRLDEQRALAARYHFASYLAAQGSPAEAFKVLGGGRPTAQRLLALPARTEAAATLGPAPAPTRERRASGGQDVFEGFLALRDRLAAADPWGSSSPVVGSHTSEGD